MGQCCSAPAEEKARSPVVNPIPQPIHMPPPNPNPGLYAPTPHPTTYQPVHLAIRNDLANFQQTWHKHSAVVVGIDFGTTESGFAFCSRPGPGEPILITNIETNESWPGIRGKFKTNTVLEYDSGWNVTKWGYPALSQRGVTKTIPGQPVHKSVELFKLHLGDMKESEKPPLPPGLSYKKAITDYLFELGKLIKTTVSKRWPHISFHNEVQIVMTVPAEFTDDTKAIMRSCAFEAKLINTEDSENLTFTTEPEAAAIYCLHYLNQYPLREYEPFMIVDCGGGTVDLTTRTLLPGKKISEITVRSGEFCGSTYVDREFLRFLARHLGIPVIRNLTEKHYSQLQYLIQEFFVRQVKVEFTGNPADFQNIILDIESYCPKAMEYVSPEFRSRLEATHWQITLDFNVVKAMFDPAVDAILSLIDSQLKASTQPCQAIFLVGGFGESQYVYNRVCDTFKRYVPLICVAHQPITAIVRGSVLYGLNIDAVTMRVLKWTYGIQCYREWNPSVDPPERRTADGRVKYFDRLAPRGMQVSVNQEFKGSYCTTYANQTRVGFPVYISSEENAAYCDGLKLLGNVEIDVPLDHSNNARREVEFMLLFGQMEIRATARVVRTGEMCQTTLKYIDV